MTKQDIEAIIKQYQNDQFLLMMKDTWSGEDFAQDAWYSNRIDTLCRELESLEAEE